MLKSKKNGKRGKRSSLHSDFKLGGENSKKGKREKLI